MLAPDPDTLAGDFQTIGSARVRFMISRPTVPSTCLTSVSISFRKLRLRRLNAMAA